MAFLPTSASALAAFSDSDSPENATFASSSYDSTTLSSDSSIAVDYLIAPPRMAHYEKVSRQIYGIYLKYIAPEDIVVYSIDE